MIKKIRYYLNEIATLKSRMQEVSDQVSSLKNLLSNDFSSPKVNLGQIQSQLNNKKDFINDLSEVEFQVFSQLGNDGILQYLINKVDIPNKTFIEFGVQDYKESNTRFLLINDNWSGYVIDGSDKSIDFIKNDVIYWLHELYAKAEFINCENINKLLVVPGFDPEIGILSIDIDGNDYWVWKAIEVVRPIIVVIEYNSLFGRNNAWTIPYDPLFVRGENDSSILYFGASLRALEILGKQKGYSLIGSCSRGLNAYFIRTDKVRKFQIKPADECYVFSKFREITKDGERVSGFNRVKLLEGYDVLDVTTGAIVKIDSSLVQI
jgi:hypothetical protein